MYICASEGANGARMDATQFEPPTFKASFRGGAFAGAGVPTSGIYSALDVTANRVVWQKRFNDGCRSGSLATAGGLVFLGRNDGRVTALDSANGDRLWEFMTEAPVNSGISTFMHKGRQMVVAYAGGSFVSAQKGDGVWLFSLDGTVGPVRAVPTRTADVANGQRIYKATCVYCHGDNGQGGEGGGKSIGAQLGVEGIRAVLVSGRDIPELVEPPLVQILSEGNLVVMSLLESIAAKDDVPAYTSTHFNLFRVANGRLAEHWHSVQTAPGADVALPADGGPQPATSNRLIAISARASLNTARALVR